MYNKFFLSLRDAQVPVTIREYLTFLEAMAKGVADCHLDDFYYLSRACLVKDERNLDKFDRVFGTCFKGLEASKDLLVADIPEEWLVSMAEKLLTPEEMAKIEAMGGWDKLMETLRQRLAEQQGRHEGGSKWIGTAGTSPYGANAIIPRGSASARTNRATAGPSRSGTAANTKIWMTRSRSAPATSKLR